MLSVLTGIGFPWFGFLLRIQRLSGEGLLSLSFQIRQQPVQSAMDLFKMWTLTQRAKRFPRADFIGHRVVLRRVETEGDAKIGQTSRILS